MNKTFLSGILTGTDKKFLPGGTPLLTLQIKSKEPVWENGAWKTVEETHEAKVFGRLVEQYEPILHHGDSVVITGKLQSRKWKGRQGEEFSSLTLKVTELESFTLGDPVEADQGKPTYEDEIPF